ncbi:Hypothetical Protein FCC1311_077092 [Hondaea fermentalgiana]|uniref:Uncharacterized protein n=1 Tax=Hondaea fermentalgiana TaxID=2315210 RepID=A0A2R5GLH5_9STRA|nr:Hypothetical Protein FCC1311_077092 [Hondaea fermentalgiana]|eukprot:GBG31485.1 Hypothetical Protein FCC1311_077092 [Hondaea fermentalgiana]
MSTKSRNGTDVAETTRVFKSFGALLVYAGCLYIVLQNDHWTTVDRYGNVALLTFLLITFIAYVYTVPG